MDWNGRDGFLEEGASEGSCRGRKRLRQGQLKGRASRKKTRVGEDSGQGRACRRRGSALIRCFSTCLTMIQSKETVLHSNTHIQMHTLTSSKLHEAKPTLLRATHSVFYMN